MNWLLTALTLCVAVPAIAGPPPAWSRSKEDGVRVSSNRGSAVVSYAISHPSDWSVARKDGAIRVSSAASRRNGVAVRPIHKEADGDEKLLRQGVETYLPAIRPALKPVGQRVEKIMGQDIPVVEFRGTLGGDDVLAYACVVTVGDAWLLVLATGRWSERATAGATLLKIVATLEAKSP